MRVEAGVTYRVAVDSHRRRRPGTFNLVARTSSGARRTTTSPTRRSSSAPRSTSTGTNVGATQEPGEPVHDENYYDPSVWYAWTAPVTGGVTLDFAGSALDVVHGVYTGRQRRRAGTRDLDARSSSGTAPSGGSGRSRASTYRIAVDGRRARRWARSASRCARRPRPANDHLRGGRAADRHDRTTSGDNIGATGENGEPNSGGSSGDFGLVPLDRARRRRAQPHADEQRLRPETARSTRERRSTR